MTSGCREPGYQSRVGHVASSWPQKNLLQASIRCACVHELAAHRKQYLACESSMQALLCSEVLQQCLYKGQRHPVALCFSTCSQWQSIIMRAGSCLEPSYIGQQARMTGEQTLYQRTPGWRLRRYHEADIVNESQRNAEVIQAHSLFAFSQQRASGTGLVSLHRGCFGVDSQRTP